MPKKFKTRENLACCGSLAFHFIHFAQALIAYPTLRDMGKKRRKEKNEWLLSNAICDSVFNISVELVSAHLDQGNTNW